MEAYKCDFCGEFFESARLAVDLPAKFYEDIVEDVNADRDEGEPEITAAELGKSAGNLWLGVMNMGEHLSDATYHACPKCFKELLDAQAKQDAKAKPWATLTGSAAILVERKAEAVAAVESDGEAQETTQEA